MKLDRKEILKALETITIAGEGKNIWMVTNVVTLAMRLLLIFCIRRMHIKKEQKTTLKKTTTTYRQKKVKKPKWKRL
jgi:ATP-binding protein involved in chromosome partitioning